MMTSTEVVDALAEPVDILYAAELAIKAMCAADHEKEAVTAIVVRASILLEGLSVDVGATPS